MTGHRDKIRGLFLAALMVFSVFAGTVAFTGAAAAQSVPDVAQDPVEFASDTTGQNHVEVVFEGDASGLSFQVENRSGGSVSTSVNSGVSDLSDGQVVLNIGQDLSGDATLVVNGNEEYDITTTSTTIENGGDTSTQVFNGETIAVLNLTQDDSGWELSEGGDFGTIRERTTGTDSVVSTVDTGSIDAVTTGETYFVVFDDDTNVSVGVRNLGLSVEPDDTNVSYTEDNATVEATAESNVAPREDVEFRLKSGGDYVDDEDITDGDNNRTVNIDGDGEVTQSFDVESGNYTIELVDIQTGISDETDTIQVTEVSGGASFAQSVTSEERGDVANVTVELANRDEATVNIGGEDVSYFAQVEIEDGNDDGEVTIEFNTFAPSSSGSFTAADDDDTVDYVGATTPGSPGSTYSIGVPLAAATYDMNMTTSDNSEEFDVGTLSLRERSTTSLRTWTASSNAYSDLDDADAVADYAQAGNVTRDSTIADGDVLVHELQASGIHGAIEAQSGSNFDALVALHDAGAINLTFVEDDSTVAPNADRGNFNLSDLGSSNVEVVSDADNNTLYVNVKSDAVLDRAATEEDDRINARFTVNESSDLTDSNQTVSAQFAVVEADAEFDTTDELADGTDVVRVRATEGQNVTGTTSLAPGTEITVAARSTGDSPFLTSSDAVVSPNGTFAATFDFSNVSAGQNFTLQIRNPSSVNDVEADAQVTAAATANVTFNDQTTSGEEVTVASATLSEGGFVTIHDSSLQDGDAFGSVRGTSSYLENGSSSGITVTLDDPVSESGTLIAMPHQDTNDNEAYDFVSSDGAQDGPYTANGSAVTDSASVTVENATETPEPTPTVTPEPTPTETSGPTTGTAEPTDDPSTPAPTTTNGDGAGFGLVVALIALIGAALLAVRRND